LRGGAGLPCRIGRTATPNVSQGVGSWQLGKTFEKGFYYYLGGPKSRPPLQRGVSKARKTTTEEKTSRKNAFGLRRKRGQNRKRKGTGVLTASHLLKLGGKKSGMGRRKTRMFGRVGQVSKVRGVGFSVEQKTVSKLSR